MGTIQKLLPGSVASNNASFNPTGAATNILAVSDSSDSSWLKAAIAGAISITFNMNNYTIPATSLCRRVRSGMRIIAPSPNKSRNQLEVAGTYPYAVDYKSAVTNTTVRAAATTILGAWVETIPTPDSYSPSNPAGTTKGWDQTELDRLRMYWTEYKSTAGERTSLIEIYAEAEIIDQPVAAVAAVATNTSKPSVSWTYTDGDGDPQTHYEFRVYKRPGASWAGFDPNTTSDVPIQESGQVAQAQLGQALINTLENGSNYRAYVRVAHYAGASHGTYWSLWAFAEWTVAISPPTVPTVTRTWNTANQRVNLTITGAAPPGGVTQTFRVERSLDGGTTWELVRGCEALVPNGSYIASPFDYEALRGTTMYYRAQANGIDAGGLAVSSAFSAAGSVVTTNDGSWWLKAVTTPAINKGACRIQENPAAAIEQNQGIFRPLGAVKALVSSGSLYGEDGSYELEGAGSTELAALEALVKHAGVLLVQSPFGGHEYVKLVARDRVILGTAAYPRVRWTLGYVEVSMPAA